MKQTMIYLHSAVLLIILCASFCEAQPNSPSDSVVQLLHQRVKRQFGNFDNINPFFNNNFNNAQQQQQAPVPDRNTRRRNQRQRIRPGAELIFSGSQGNNQQTPNMPTASSTMGPVVFINNQPVAVGATPNFVDPITTPQYLRCFDSCPTTSEYNPICANDRNRYHNEQKFNCARGCGANIQILRRGSCEGLFPMSRG